MVDRMVDREKLSALMDGELVDKALIGELENDQNGQRVWQNYHLIGDVIRGEAPESLDWNIAESVAFALNEEKNHSNVIPVADHNIESQPSPVKARMQLPKWLSSMGQVATAACVSLVVILGVQNYPGNEPSAAKVDTLPVLQTVPFAGSVEPVSLTRSSLQEQHNSVNLQEQHRRVNSMLRDFELQLRLNSERNTGESNIPKTVVE